MGDVLLSMWVVSDKPPLDMPQKRQIASLKRLKRKKAPSIAKLKKELEMLQKALVIKTYGNDCYTCSAIGLIGKNQHLGHIPWPRTDLSIECKFSPEYTRIQCMVCNVHKGGRGAVALQRMLDENIDILSLRKRNEETKGNHPPRSWYERKVEEYKAILEELEQPRP